MKTIFVDAKYKLNSLKDFSAIKIKEKRIGIVGTIQTNHILTQIVDYLSSNGHEVQIAGQVVGCNVSKAIAIKNVDAYLFVGSGMFHPLELLDKTNVKKYYQFNPVYKKFSKIKNEDIIKLQKQRNAKIAKFHSSKRIGVIVTTKPGQENLKGALKFAKESDKEVYLFLDNLIDVSKLEDFNNIDYWVNTACPRLEEKGIISLRDVL